MTVGTSPFRTLLRRNSAESQVNSGRRVVGLSLFGQPQESEDTGHAARLGFLCRGWLALCSISLWNSASPTGRGYQSLVVAFSVRAASRFAARRLPLSVLGRGLCVTVDFFEVRLTPVPTRDDLSTIFMTNLSCSFGF